MQFVRKFILTAIFAAMAWAGTSLAQNLGVPPDRADAPFVRGRVLVKFRPEFSGAPVQSLIAGAHGRDNGEIPGTGVHMVQLPDNVDEEAITRAFRVQREVEFAELDRVLLPEEVIPNDPWYANWEWHLQKINGPMAWGVNSGSSNVVIAILDTGVDGTHEDLASKMIPGWNSYNNNTDTRDCCGHGTAVAGTAAAASNNGIGVASVAWGCSIMPIRVSDASAYATYSSIASGLTWAADHGAKIANVSWLVSGSSTVTSGAKYFQGKGGIVVASAGNYGTFDSSPDDPYILTISATDRYDVLTYYSNTGNNIDLSSPGEAFSTQLGGGYVRVGGTSYSAPIVAGVAALVFSANPSLTSLQVQDILKKSADDLGSSGWDSSYGWGRVNAGRAVSMALGLDGGTSDTIPPSVAITSLAPGSTVSGTMLLQVSATDSNGVASVSVSVDGTLIGTDTSSPYDFYWNTTLLANGTHTLSATARDGSANSASVSETVMVNNIVDNIAPSIRIVSPAGGSHVTGNISILEDVSDNVGVAKVELYVDGKLQASSTNAPFTIKWNTAKASKGRHDLQSKATDLAGNNASSPICSVYK